MLVIGGGIVSLEMATVYSALGARVDVVEMQGHADARPRPRSGAHLGRTEPASLRQHHAARTVAADAREDGVWIRFEGDMAPAEAQRYDMVLQSVGRKPSNMHIATEKAGITVSGGRLHCRQQPHGDHTCRIFTPSATSLACRCWPTRRCLQRPTWRPNPPPASTVITTRIPGVAYASRDRLGRLCPGRGETQGAWSSTVARFPWAASGRAIVNGADYGMTKLVFDRDGGAILGGAIAGPAPAT